VTGHAPPGEEATKNDEIAKGFTEASPARGRDLLLPFGDAVGVVLKAYLDDSGSDADLRGVVIAGFVASATDWKRLEERWVRLEDKRQIGHFHASKMRRRGGPCDGWPYPRWHQLLSDCTNAVTYPGIIHVGGCMLSETWARYGAEVNEAMRPRQGPNPKPMTADVFCLNHALQQIASITKRYFPGEHTGIFIERPATGKQASMKETLKAYTTSPPWSKYLTSTGIGDRDTHPGLRVADFAANATFRHLRDFIETPKEPPPMRDPFSLAITQGKIESAAKYYSDEGMEEALRMIKEGVFASEEVV
jgi:hypothetical protein